MVFAGRDSSQNYFNDLHALDLNSHKWEQINTEGDVPLPCPRSFHTCAVHQRNMVVFGGSNHSGRLNDMFSFSFDTQMWTQLTANVDADTTVPGPRSEASAVQHDGMMYVFGGSTAATVPSVASDPIMFTNFSSMNDSKLGDLYVFNTTSETWAVISAQVESTRDNSNFSYVGFFDICARLWRWANM